MDERLKKYVDEVIAPKLQGDGGFIGIDVTVFAERKKPFFWDTI